MSHLDQVASHRTSDTIEQGNGNHHHTEAKYGGGQSVARYLTAGGTPADSSNPAFPVYHRKLGNPSPLGLLGFGGTTFLLSLYNVNTRGINTPNVILGPALAYGGLAQLIAGIEEWVCGNTFAGTAFSSYGAFWISFACLYIPQFKIADAYAVAGEFDNAVGLFLAMWGVITFIFFLACWKSSIALCALFGCLDVTFWLLTAAFLAPNAKCGIAGGAMGIVTAFIAFYIALAGMLTPDTSYYTLPTGDLSRAKKNE
ncbi:GPR1/FUN34/yaaH family-domain-containing protein [Kockovaella imperatae]|uniref:GPR1/FUN34/yaaH family-domain-containing protein n=1 Tax=Kockovaella imperatae TaxID=4999 RepID=A0A1Y1UNJ3_9TREE|nr:GPR1/FUN34/yaaH family-domain-containing protein [Kockovaella imperatae]ORX39026.1 GPR1/FUN34/yaaH family-domain-containing protein [Kockovaella imperatae]